MKKMCIVLALLLCLCVSAMAEGGVSMEVIKKDGVSVVMLIPEENVRRARSLAVEKAPAGFVLPDFLTLIEESAFEGMAAETVEISGHVTAIEARAFADCKSLREITIPATVLKIDDSAFDGCEGVTVYGEKNSEAERIAKLYESYGFTFEDVNVVQEQPETPAVRENPPVVMPFVPADD